MYIQNFPRDSGTDRFFTGSTYVICCTQSVLCTVCTTVPYTVSVLTKTPGGKAKMLADTSEASPSGNFALFQNKTLRLVRVEHHQYDKMMRTPRDARVGLAPVACMMCLCICQRSLSRVNAVTTTAMGHWQLT